MKIAYVTSNKPSEYHKKFAELLRNFGEVKHFKGREGLNRTKNHNLTFIESIGFEALDCLENGSGKIIIRMTGVEPYVGHLNRVKWEKVSKLLAYSQHQINYFKKAWKGCHPKSYGIIPPVALLNQFPLKKERTQGNKVAVIANITGRKNLQEIPIFLKRHPKLHVYHLGQVCAYGAPIKDYIDCAVNKLKVSDRYHWQKHIPYKEINTWLENKDYMWLPSVQEGFNRSILEGMSKGLTPIIKAYGGAQMLWPEKYIYDDMNDIKLNIEEPAKMREYVKEHYNEQKITNLIKKELNFK